MSSLYDDILLDHIRNARNFRAMDHPSREAAAENPLCGDTFTVQVRLSGDVIEDAAFKCECCGISMASASIMTEWVRGKTVAEALAIRQRFVDAVAAHADTAGSGAPDDHEAVLRVVRATPSREGCATLAWTALETALRSDR